MTSSPRLAPSGDITDGLRGRGPRVSAVHFETRCPPPKPEPTHAEHNELPVEELLRRARPLPPYGEMVIEDLDPDDADAFLAAVLG